MHSHVRGVRYAIRVLGHPPMRSEEGVKNPRREEGLPSPILPQFPRTIATTSPITKTIPSNCRIKYTLYGAGYPAAASMYSGPMIESKTNRAQNHPRFWFSKLMTTSRYSPLSIHASIIQRSRDRAGIWPLRANCFAPSRKVRPERTLRCLVRKSRTRLGSA